jgi:hypothetical protein
MVEADGGEGGGSAIQAQAGAPSPAPSPTGGEGGTVLGTAGADIPAHERFPEKYRVFKDDKSFDLEGTAFKTAEAYQSLEKRLGAGDLPPKTVDEYKIEKLSGDINVDDVMKDPITKSLLARMHAKGATNAIVQEVLDFALSEWAPKLIAGNQALTEETCVDELRKSWATDEDYTANTAAAFRATKGFANDGDESAIGSYARLDKKFGNDPDFIAFCANIGREMSEDRVPDFGQQGGGKTIDELMMDPAYTDPKNPNHARVSEQVRRYYERKHGTAASL